MLVPSVLHIRPGYHVGQSSRCSPVVSPYLGPRRYLIVPIARLRIASRWVGISANNRSTTQQIGISESLLISQECSGTSRCASQRLLLSPSLQDRWTPTCVQPLAHSNRAGPSSPRLTPRFPPALAIPTDPPQTSATAKRISPTDRPARSRTRFPRAPVVVAYGRRPSPPVCQGYPQHRPASRWLWIPKVWWWQVAAWWRRI